MTIAVIGATGRVGGAVVQNLLDRGEAVTALVRDEAKARTKFRAAQGLEVRQVVLDRPTDVEAALEGAGIVFLAMGSVGIEGNIQRLAVQAAAARGVDQLVRLSVLNAGPDSLGINQRAHSTIDFAAEAAGLAYTTIRPAIWSASIVLGGPEIRKARTWTGLADHGRVALSDHRDAVDAAVHILTNPPTWGQHYDLTGPDLFSWPDALVVLSQLLGEEVSFVTTTERELLRRLTQAGIAPAQAELLISREWAILAGENERTTSSFEKLVGRPPRTLHDFLTEQLEIFR